MVKNNESLCDSYRRHIYRMNLLKYVVAGTWFGIVSDMLGVKFGYWAHVAPWSQLVNIPMWTFYFTFMYLMIPKIKHWIRYFVVGLYAVLFDVYLISSGLLVMKFHHFLGDIPVGSNWMPIGELGWMLVAPSIYFISITMWVKLKRFTDGELPFATWFAVIIPLVTALSVLYVKLYTIGS